MASIRKATPAHLTTLADRAILPGLLGFTRAGYLIRADCRDGLPERIDGRRIVLTGATSGLGLAAARQLATMGADLVLVGRDATRLEQVAGALAATAGARPPQTELADLSLLRDVRALADRLSAAKAGIDVLINNAGALFDRRETTDEGHERALAVNLLAPYLLTSLLVPTLKSSAPARIVNVSSGGMYTQRFDVDDLQYERASYDGPRAYARAKRALVTITEQWAAELAASGVVVHAMHPGWADTPGVRQSLPGFYRLTRPVLRTPEQGADTIVWLAAADEPARSTGGFWLDRRVHPTHVLPGTRAAAGDGERLRAALDELTGVG